jgi:hypothetical protein
LGPSVLDWTFDPPLDIDKIAKRVDAFQRLYNHPDPTAPLPE